MIAIAVPSAQPATTSESQCTASIRRLRPTRPTPTRPARSHRSCPLRRTATVRARTKDPARRHAAASVAWPDGKAADVTVAAWTVTGGRSRPKRALAPVEARVATSSDTSGASASAHCQPPHSKEECQEQRENRQANKAPQGAENLGNEHPGVGPHPDEPGQDRLIVGDEPTTVKQVICNEDEYRKT